MFRLAFLKVVVRTSSAPTLATRAGGLAADVYGLRSGDTRYDSTKKFDRNGRRHKANSEKAGQKRVLRYVQ